ncbi:MAG: OmpA family protein [Bacteroidales bacterium]|nr:OmpA family protein [Bacteroidales bacterium]
MKTYKIFILVFIMLFGLNVYSQKRLIEKGNKEYFVYNYDRAIRLFESVDNKNIEIERILADCYTKIENFQNAKVYYLKILNKPERTFDDVWHFFQVLLILEEYSEAMKLLDTLSELNPSDTRVIAYLNDTTYFEKLKQNEPIFEVRNLRMNNSQQDFAPVIYHDNVVFASSRNRQGLISRIWNGNRLPYLNILRARIDYDDELKRVKTFDRKFIKKFHDGPACFNSDGTLMVLTRNNYGGKSADGTRHLQIFTSELVEGRWTPPVSFPYNNPEYSVGQASLTPDGRFMYFASDMPGGKGGTDIYKIERRIDGTWGTLENLESVNTEGNELFPYYHSTGVLFFSSDGHPGLGGLDIFVTSSQTDVSGQIKNLGTPVNSSKDDFAMALNNELQKGYFSSNRIEGKGSDDIYFVNALKPLKLRKIIKGVSKDKQDNIIAETMVKLLFDGVVVDSTLSDSLGRYEFPVETFGLYHLTGDKVGYIGGNNIADTDVPEEIIYADIILDRIPVFALHILVTGKNSGLPLENVKISLVNISSGVDEVIYSSVNGDFSRVLEEISLNDTLNYRLKFEKERYFTVFTNYSELVDREGIYEIKEEMLSYDDLRIGDDLAKIFKINMIYFDLDKHNIRPDAAIELDKIVEIMNQYPSMFIELGSHTDCRASISYNIRLSDRRAKSSAAYIKERITNPARIYGRGYGESNLVNRCECEGTRAVPCSEEEHQMNRRTEFKIIKL